MNHLNPLLTRASETLVSQTTHTTRVGSVMMMMMKHLDRASHRSVSFFRSFVLLLHTVVCSECAKPCSGLWRDPWLKHGIPIPNLALFLWRPLLTWSVLAMILKGRNVGLFCIEMRTLKVQLRKKEYEAGKWALFLWLKSQRREHYYVCPINRHWGLFRLIKGYVSQFPLMKYVGLVYTLLVRWKCNYYPKVGYPPIAN